MRPPNFKSLALAVFEWQLFKRPGAAPRELRPRCYAVANGALSGDAARNFERSPRRNQ
jgi:hypothetical protein